MPRKPKTDRKTVEIARKGIPLRKLLHGKEIRDAAAELENFRLKMNEQEFLYGAKIYIDWKDSNTADIVARRLETDKEYEDRLERARIAAEQKAERERRAKELEGQRALQREIRKKTEAALLIKQLAKEAGILVDILDQ
jgi:hypothetical protein